MARRRRTRTCAAVVGLLAAFPAQAEASRPSAPLPGWTGYPQVQQAQNKGSSGSDPPVVVSLVQLKTPAFTISTIPTLHQQQRYHLFQVKSLRVITVSPRRVFVETDLFDVWALFFNFWVDCTVVTVLQLYYCCEWEPFEVPCGAALSSSSSTDSTCLRYG